MNVETKAVLFHMAMRWLGEGATEIQDQWSDVGSASAPELLAAQLKEDLTKEIRELCKEASAYLGGRDGKPLCDEGLLPALLWNGLKRVNWLTIACSLLRRAEPAEKTEKEGGPDGGECA
jgi:hypothetical protein